MIVCLINMCYRRLNVLELGITQKLAFTVFFYIVLMLVHGDKKLLWLLCGSQMVIVRKCHHLKGTAMSRCVCVCECKHIYAYKKNKLSVKRSEKYLNLHTLPEGSAKS